MTVPKPLPAPLQAIKQKAAALLSTMPSAPGATSGYPSLRSKAGNALPPHYLIYFVLVNLLGYKAHGPHEKVAWSIPVRSKGIILAVEHRKLGLGIFVSNAAKDEAEAQRVADLLVQAVRIAEPYFDWLAQQAVAGSELNVLNRSRTLFGRYEYLLGLHKRAAALEKKTAGKIISRKLTKGVTSFKIPSIEHRRRAEWLALACIEAFFSWTEHVFIHLALLRRKIETAAEVEALSTETWNEKFKAALDVTDPVTRSHYDQLQEIRRQLRNFVAHGAFGKQGEAFMFHSDAGAVPVYLPHRRRGKQFTLHEGGAFDDALALKTIADFIAHLWSGPRAPARLFIQEHGMATILPFVADGTYDLAMSSEASMKDFLEYWLQIEDNAANME